MVDSASRCIPLLALACSSCNSTATNRCAGLQLMVHKLWIIKTAYLIPIQYWLQLWVQAHAALKHHQRGKCIVAAQLQQSKCLHHRTEHSKIDLPCTPPTNRQLLKDTYVRYATRAKINVLYLNQKISNLTKSNTLELEGRLRVHRTWMMQVLVGLSCRPR